MSHTLLDLTRLERGKRALFAAALALVLCPLLTTQGSAKALASASMRLSVDSPQELRNIAFHHILENQRDAAFKYYQRAIDKSTKDFGVDAGYTGDLYFEMGVLALSMSKFTMAEHCLSNACTINPHKVMARLKLAELLRIREKPQAARALIQQSVAKNINSALARRELAALLQANNPAEAAHQSYLVRQILSGVSLQANMPKPNGTDLVTPANPAMGNAAATRLVDGNKTKTATKPGVEKPASIKPRPSKSVIHIVRSKPSRTIAKMTSIIHNSPHGLVPPPPPIAIFQPGVANLDQSEQAIQLKTDAKVKNKSKRTKSNSAEIPESATMGAPPKASQAHDRKLPDANGGQESDPDFLIEWASVKKKPAK